MVTGLMGEFDLGVLVIIDIISRIIEIMAVILIFGSIILGTWRFFYPEGGQTLESPDRGIVFRHFLARWLLISLELLVAADVIRTVALDQTLESVAGLGLLVLIRTFLSWALVVEMEGRWPWQEGKRVNN